MSKDNVIEAVFVAFRESYSDADGAVRLPWERVRPILVAMQEAGYPVFPGEPIPPL